MNKVFLVTKLRSTNLGNQALSMELIKIFEEKIGKDHLYVAGRPNGLLGYSFKALSTAKEPELLFDKWADAAIKKYHGMNRSPVFVARTEDFKLDLNNKQAIRADSFKSMLRPLKRLLQKAVIFNSDYVQRLDTISSSDYYLYSGAGEIGDYHIFLRQLLEIRIAQKLGKKTGAINQSVTVRTDLYKRIVKHVYGKMEKIVVRGEISHANLLEFGIKDSIITVAPDTAIRTSVPFEKQPGTGLVGINFTPEISYEWHEIELIVNKLQEHNKKMVFISNEPIGEIPVMTEFKKRFNVDAISESSGYLEYAKKLAQFDFVISARLHTNVMALSVNTPIIPIEGKVFKTKELMNVFEYPIVAANVNDKTWTTQVLDSIDRLVAGKIDFKNYFENVLPKHKQDVYLNVSWINNN